MLNVTKQFDGVRALHDVDLTVEAGEVRGLVGENGSGKTTLVRVLGGEVQPDSGVVRIAGDEIHALNRAERLAAGVGVVFQEPHVCPELSVAENVLLGRLPGGFIVRWGKTRRAAAMALRTAGFPLSPRARVRSLGQDAQHVVDVGRIEARDCRVLAFDETTASLTADYVSVLFDLVRRRRDQGAAVIFVSHRLREVLEVCDTVTVLRDGAVTGTRSIAGTTEAELIQLMVGRSIEADMERPISNFGDTVLELRDVQPKGHTDTVNLEVRAGEVVGIGGLVGSGRTELLEAIFGLSPRRGEVLVDGQALKAGDPRAAISAGIGFVPEDRRAGGLAMEQSVRANATMVVTGMSSMWRRPSRAADAAAVGEMVTRLSLKAGDLNAPVRTLSGGNQQKIMLGRWLSRRPRVLLLDEPTRGIDVGAKREIYALINSLVARGTAVVLVSSELPELIHLSDRIVVLREGAVAGQLGRQVTEEEVVTAMAGSA
jgi:ABC-type sugar transport system ATPase subunit